MVYEMQQVAVEVVMVAEAKVVVVSKVEWGWERTQEQ